MEICDEYFTYNSRSGGKVEPLCAKCADGYLETHNAPYCSYVEWDCEAEHWIMTTCQNTREKHWQEFNTRTEAYEIPFLKKNVLWVKNLIPEAKWDEFVHNKLKRKFENNVQTMSKKQ